MLQISFSWNFGGKEKAGWMFEQLSQASKQSQGIALLSVKNTQETAPLLPGVTPGGVTRSGN